MTPEEKLKQIAKILDSMGPDDAYYNLEGAIQDINNDNNHCDFVSMGTLKRVQEQLLKISQVLDA